MKKFNFINVNSKGEALEVLQKEKENACIIAGATNVMPLIRTGRIKDKTLINIRDLKELRYIKETDEKILIGSLTTIADLEKSRVLKNYARALVEAARNFADPTTCNSATIGGNIANASPAADTAPPLLALNATVVVASRAKGERIIPIEEIFKGVNETSLACDEIISEIQVPKNEANKISWFIKIGLRNAMAISIVSAAACMEIHSGKVKDVRVALGSVAPIPVRSKTVEKELMGRDFTEKVIEEAAQAVIKDISPIDDIRASKEYRQQVAAVVVKRVLKKIGSI
ncbi:MAG: xanthine dehydrogenase family protein subunit M [Dehalobacterium sp.]